MKYRRLHSSQIDPLWELHRLYKAEIGEEEPDPEALARLKEAIGKQQILFFGARDRTLLAGCCSVTPGFSTYNYARSGVFEDFYIRPEYRHQGIARELVRFAYLKSGVSSLTVGCADCDLPMYRSLGFSIPLGTMLAFEP